MRAETREAVESLDTLVHARGAHDPEGSLGRPVLGRYRLLERLGAGGFGVVWRAHDELLHREVAVKRISLPPDGDSERATREALATARLSHPAIVALYEASAVRDAFYLISELVHGDTLARLIATDALEDEEILEIGVALTGALAHAHARGVIHRDVKPQNVLVPHSCEDPLAVAKLTDFGGARLTGEDVLTRTGDVLGTLAYMAPEQSEGQEAGEQADLYSLALVLYEALSGVNPVRGSTPAETARRIGRPLTPLEHARGDLPPALTDALDAALAPLASDRGSIEELRGELEHALAHGLTRRRGSRRPRRRPQTLEGFAPAAEARTLEEALEGAATRLEARPERHAARLGARASRPGNAPPRAARDEDVALEVPPAQAPARGLSLPRIVWLACALAVIAWQAASGRPGVALLLLAGTLPLAVLLPRRSGPAWLACALAPVLGLIGLAGVFPALAGQAGRWRRRAAFGALGYWWLTLAEPLLARRLWLGQPAGTPARSVWEGSIGHALHLLGGMASFGVLLGALLWAAGSALLPWLVRGSRATLDLLAAATWTAALALSAPALDHGLSARPLPAGPHGAVLGAILAAAVAVSARALRGPI